MIAVASSTPVALSRATEVANTDWLDQALALQQAVLPPVVFTEALRTPELDCETADLLQDLPVLDIRSGFRERAAETRARILAKRSRARLAVVGELARLVRYGDTFLRPKKGQYALLEWQERDASPGRRAVPAPIRRVVGLPEGEGRHRENVFGATADYVTSRKRSSPSARRSNSEGMWPGA